MKNGNDKENDFKNHLQHHLDPVLTQHKSIQFSQNQDNAEGKFERRTKVA